MCDALYNMHFLLQFFRNKVRIFVSAYFFKMQENTTLPRVSGQCVGAVSSIGAYFSEVCTGKAVVPVALTFMAFAVLDFDVQKGMLKVVHVYHQIFLANARVQEI